MKSNDSSILIKNGTVVTHEKVFKADIFIVGETIELIQEKIEKKARKIIDAQGKYIFPGGIDAHTHMNLPVMGTFSSDTFKTGTKAALFGGTTTIIDFANQKKGESLRSAIDYWHKLADGNSFCDYAFHLSVTDLNSKTKKEIKNIFLKDGITSFKTFMAYDAMKISDESLKELMLMVKKLGGIVTLHAEIGSMISDKVLEFKKKNKLTPRYHPLTHPVAAEVLAIKNFAGLCKETGCPSYVVHLSSGDGLKEIKKAKLKNLFAETCTQYLLCNDSGYSKKDFREASKFVMSPPLRKKENQVSLWKGLLAKKIQVVATDHCPFLLKQKEAGSEDFTKIPNGAPGVEHRIELLYSEGVKKRKLPLEDFVKITSTNPAKLFGLYPKKGVVAVGSDADLVIFDPKKVWNIKASEQHMNCDYSLYEGKIVKGKCETVILRGDIIIREGKFVAKNSHGRYLKRNKSSFNL